MTTFNLERSFSPSQICLGIDEAGCGPWVGPVVVAGVWVSPSFYERGEKLGLLKDSKKLSSKKRLEASLWIKNHAKFALGAANAQEIDSLNIAKATALATHRMFQKWKKKYFFACENREEDSLIALIALIDGIRNPKLPMETHMIVGGDGKSCSIAAASILAKVTRDNIMKRLSRAYPHYGFQKNAGYGTKEHINALNLFGVTPYHRQSYAPIQKLLSAS